MHTDIFDWSCWKSRWIRCTNRTRRAKEEFWKAAFPTIYRWTEFLVGCSATFWNKLLRIQKNKRYKSSLWDRTIEIFNEKLAVESRNWLLNLAVPLKKRHDQLQKWKEDSKKINFLVDEVLDDSFLSMDHIQEKQTEKKNKLIKFSLFQQLDRKFLVILIKKTYFLLGRKTDRGDRNCHL